ncbi:vacuolar protein sorting-associated protein 16 homolog [Galendromus occidentalis]|uniref:Vacuolar protein sorting-associated protein 16 homolog n=1 Tax=Galendromus occidentalis TaxID=34638 RepID=A0AAJ6QQH0_9ACAR|nr:vacuolar protein sorting-associated protein 16 homolog [Galendromus occidentalis]
MFDSGTSLSSLLTQGWSPLGADTNYRKLELYEMQWHAQLPVHLQDFLVAVAPFGGAIALLRKDRVGKPGEWIHVFSAAGSPIKNIRWEGGAISNLGWSASEELVVVSVDGSVHVFPLDPHIVRVKTSFTLGKEAKDLGVIDSRVFNSRHNGSTGVAVLTAAYRFFVVKSLQDPRTNALKEIGLDSPPSCWQVVSTADNLRIIVAKDTLIYILDVNDRSLKQVSVHFDSGITAITEMCLSFNQQQLALFADTGAVWMGLSDLSMKKSEHNTKNRGRPKMMVWCGKEAVVATWNNLLILVGFEQQDMRYAFDEAIHVVAEPDGCRIVSNTRQYLLHKVPNEVNDVCKLGSFAPGRLLLEASEAYRKHLHTADDYLASIKEDDQLDVAVEQCIRAAGHQWDEVTQKALLKAASFGKVFQSEQKDPDEYVTMCKKMRVLNAIRSPEIGMPLSFRQFDGLGERVVIDRLIVRQHWPIAQTISSFLKLGMENKILVHWACYKVEQKHLKTDEVAKAIGERLAHVPAIQYSEIANRAADEGRKDLAVLLLNFEPRAAEQVPLLLKLTKPEDALMKAIESGDADLVYQAIFHMKDHSPAGFNLSLRKFPVALNLYLKMCRENNREILENLIDQEDDHAAMAKIKMEDAAATPQREQKLALLKTASEQFRRAPDEFSAKQMELHVKLLTIQQKMEQKEPSRQLFGKSLNHTITLLLKDGEFRMAEDLRRDFAVSDKRWMWLRAQVFAKEKQWGELEKLSKLKRIPLIGFEGFAELCLRVNDKQEALKYILKLKEDSKVNYVLRFTDGDISKAARLALEQRDLECLHLLREKAIEKPKTASLANEIDEFILTLSAKR